MSIFWKTNPIALLAHFLLDVTLSTRSRRRQAAALRHLDSRLLRDIGLCQRDVSLMQAGLAEDTRLRENGLPFAARRNPTLSQVQPR